MELFLVTLERSEIKNADFSYSKTWGARSADKKEHFTPVLNEVLVREQNSADEADGIFIPSVHNLTASVLIETEHPNHIKDARLFPLLVGKRLILEHLEGKGNSLHFK
jgi:hypothetical protein